MEPTYRPTRWRLAAKASCSPMSDPEVCRGTSRVFTVPHGIGFGVSASPFQVLYCIELHGRLQDSNPRNSRGFWLAPLQTVCFAQRPHLAILNSRHAYSDSILPIGHRAWREVLQHSNARHPFGPVVRCWAIRRQQKAPLRSKSDWGSLRL